MHANGKVRRGHPPIAFGVEARRPLRVNFGADTIMTFNLKDFPEDALKPYSIEPFFGTPRAQTVSSLREYAERI